MSPRVFGLSFGITCEGTRRHAFPGGPMPDELTIISAVFGCGMLLLVSVR